MTPFTLEDGSITGRNRPFFNNRPLYGDHRSSVILAGDRPHLRFANKPNVYGCMTLAIQRGSDAQWLHNAEAVISRYRPGRMAWEVSDPEFHGMTITLEVIPLAGAEGFAAHLSAQGTRAGDQLIWCFGGATPVGDASAHFDPIIRTIIEEGKVQLSPVLSQCFQPEDCINNTVAMHADRFLLTTNGVVRYVFGRCTQGSLHLGDASAWPGPDQLLTKAAGKLPLACGLVELAENADVFWAFEAFDAPDSASPACDDPGRAFNLARERVDALAKRIILNTPDPRLDAGVAAACYAMDSTYYPPVYVHGAMAWNIPFPGWRSIYGATAFGWHDNVKTEARYYIASQNRETTPRVARPNVDRRLCTQNAESRFHGRGRITQDDGPYNFQTQFFDQLVHAWRWTGDAELEKVLRDALDLHLEWARDCFDPDDDGLYESYINSWPTDSVWYNGGGSVEESVYAFAGHRAAAEMARHSGDVSAAARHETQGHKIRAALMHELWIARKGYMAQYKEQGGHRRVHEDSWLAAIFLPIECGLLEPGQAVQSLYYTEYALQRVHLPYGGSRCWMSNWVPAPWSTRELHPGDDYALALAYFRTGLADEGWDLLKGNYLASMYHGVVPGGQAGAHCGTDFSDILSMFCRTVVEGLFGYHPDYPNGTVTISPQFPTAWDKGSIKTPDVDIQFRSSAETHAWTVSLTQAA
ncbi:MAG: DUF4450 domain-containing protein, partial [Verrucomicrobia bacterium]|nr:DUF4450 domain-containing protein [Verrucomicrobiota bacterium]